ncbi:MAG: FHA domain-containing protein [Planctomycetes bacterium]|nr:FHA domain-containing protein [Planctomycetota bacterium]
MTESSSATDQLSQGVFVLCLGDLAKVLEPGRSYTVGRDIDCDVRLGHHTVSDRHCRLEVHADRVVVHDLDSACGTKVDGHPVLDQSWAPGEVLEVGDIRIDLDRRPLEPAAPSFETPSALQVHRAEPEFGEMVLAELKRAPWFGMSVLIHAIVLLLAWFFSQQVVPKGALNTVVSLEQSEEQEEIEDDRAEVETMEEEAAMEDSDLREREVLLQEETPVQEIVEPVFDQGSTDLGDLLTKVGSGTGINDILKVGGAAMSGRFKRTVGTLRRDGLEIMFVFDSTGSMGAVLKQAKDRMAKMATVLLELVPYARIGVVTYRDKHKTEDYLTRQVGLSRDFYRAINFMQRIYAGGGGDPPEAVYEALGEAKRQKWTASARRMIVLIGDAPPHAETEGRISAMVKDFAHNGRSFVHTIITRPSAAREVSADTTKSFERIARDGHGETLTFEDEAKILQAVMSLAFGRMESRSLDEVYRLVDKRADEASEEAKKVASGKELKELRVAFSRNVVSHDLVKAILKDPNPVVLKELVGFARQRSFPSPGKHAAAYILYRVLGLDDPPVDPETQRPLDRARAQDLLRRIERRRR